MRRIRSKKGSLALPPKCGNFLAILWEAWAAGVLLLPGSELGWGDRAGDSGANM